jgi:hypothetical protein
MSISTKILLFLGAFLTLGALSFIIYKQVENSKRQEAIESSVVKQKELIDNIMRSMSEYSTKKDLESFIKDNNVNLKAIQDDLGKLNANLTAVNLIIANSKGSSQSNIPSSGVGPQNPNPQPLECKLCDPNSYMKNAQNLDLNEDFENVRVPIGNVSFSAWRDKPWDLNIAPRQYQLINVIGTDENQRMYVYNKFSIQINDKKYDIKINKALTEQEFPMAKFTFWNPRLYLGLYAGIAFPSQAEFTPSLSLAIMSYGKFVNQPDFSVLQFGVGYESINKKGKLLFTPFTYNIGQHLPLLTNVHIGPSIHFGFDSAISIMGGISVGL